MVKYNPPHQDLFERSLDQQETPPDLHETQVVEVEVEEKGVKNNNNNINNNSSNNSHNLTHHQNNNNKSPPPPTNPNSFILHLPSTFQHRKTQWLVLTNEQRKGQIKPSPSLCYFPSSRFPSCWFLRIVSNNRKKATCRKRRFVLIVRLR